MHVVSAYVDSSSHTRFLHAVPGPTSVHPRHPVVERAHGGERFVVPTVTAPEQHPCGWDVEIALVGAGKVWRSGEVLRGKVELKPRQGWEQQKVASLVVRCYWQSTTLFTEFSYTKNGHQDLLAAPGTPTYLERAEYHRGYAPTAGEGLDLPLPASLPSSAPSSFDFAFTLPATTHSSFSNPTWCPPSSRSELMKHERCAPPSFDTGSVHDGTVEWVVEVLLRLEPPEGGRLFGASPTSTEELPPFDPAPAASGELSSRGLLRSTEKCLIKRVTFPFEPYDRFVEDTQSAWHGKVGAVVPGLGRDPRDELTATKVVEADEIGEDRLVSRNGGAEEWTTYFKEQSVKSGLMAKSTVLRAEISFPSPLLVSRSSPSLPFLLHLRHFYPSSSRSKASSGSSTPRLVKLDILTLTLVERILKRGGSAVTPVMELREVMKEEFVLAELLTRHQSQDNDGGALSRESTGSAEMVVARTEKEGKKGKKEKHKEKRPSLRLCAAPSAHSVPAHHLPPSPPPSRTPSSASVSTLPSSVASISSSTPPSFVDLPLSLPLPRGEKRLGLTFRTPNLEREYIMSATLSLAGQGALGGVVLARVPVQVVTGDRGDEEEEAEREEEIREEEEGGVRFGRRDTEGWSRREKLPYYEEWKEQT